MSDQLVLLVDDEPDILQLLEITLARMNLNTRCAASVAEAKTALAERQPDLCLTDMRLPDGSGLALVEHIQSHFPDVPVAMITAHGSVESAIEALKLGAFDFVSKPLALDKLRELVGHALNMRKARADEAERALIGDSPLMAELRVQVAKVARSQAPVHIHGESGVGKEVVARLIHQLGPRAKKPFIAVNCGAIPPDLVESELFGHIRGAFTGAHSDKAGLFQAAAGGTLLLDEVADLPAAMQVKLLRVIQEKAVRPVGAQQEVATDVRLLSATHKDLTAEVQAGRFRDDLFYRINVIGIEVPSLREHPEDIGAIAEHLLARMADEQGTPRRTLDASARTALAAHDFPGNVRELENILARANALTEAEAEAITAADLRFRSLGNPEPNPGAAIEATPSAATPALTLEAVDGDLEGFLERTERAILNDALLKHRWNKTATAKALGISFRSLRYRLKKLGIED